jgi:hypothetical protein
VNSDKRWRKTRKMNTYFLFLAAPTEVGSKADGDAIACANDRFGKVAHVHDQALESHVEALLGRHWT